MKKNTIRILRTLLLLITILCMMMTPTYANDNITIQLDGVELTFDVPPQIINGRTMVPLRKIFESMGATVDWDGSTQTAIAKDEKCIVHATINNNTMKINGTPKTMDVAPQLIDGRTLVPARFVAEAFGATVEWDSNTSTVIITSLKIDESTDAKTTLYSADGRQIEVPDSQVEIYKELCWYTEPVQLLYAPDGGNSLILQSEVGYYLENGWFAEPPVCMYSADGRTLYINQSEVEVYKSIGWYTEPVVVMYAPDGRTLYVGQSEVEAQKNVGWYTEPVVIMYAPDGRTLYVGQSEVQAYKNVGWYETEFEAQEANKPKNNYTTTYNPSSDGYYYRTPYGKKYHLDPNCGGKNSFRTSDISGLSPCSKCAR